MAANECGTSRIVGCRFSLYPMTDQFVEVITEALKNVETSKVWMRTDDVSTCIRGRASHVFDVAKAVFVHVAKTGVHVVFNGTFSVGCPGDSAGDVYLSEDDERLNEQFLKKFEVEAATQFALYPLGTENYMDIIYEQVEQAKKRGTFTKSVHYASRLDGSVHDVFATLENAFRRAKSETNHLVMTAVVSANSPSKKDV